VIKNSNELVQRFLFLILALIVYRAGAHIPVPGIDPGELSNLFNGRAGGVLGLFNMFSGGALSRFTIFALGIMPYISASIIMQLLGHALPSLEVLKKDGQAGRRRITQLTRYGAFLLAVVQSFGIAVALEGSVGLVDSPGLEFRFIAVVSLVAGTVFLMWLGEQITERGLGNGISILIFAGIVSGLPSAGGQFLALITQGAIGVFGSIIILTLILFVTYTVVFVERGQRKILVNYSSKMVKDKRTVTQSSHLPLKLNMSGVIPPIFASSIILLPTTVIAWFASSDNFEWIRDVSSLLAPGRPVYIVAYAVCIMFFCFFYTALVFNSRETAENLKKSGGFIPGVRPGENTAKYIDLILGRLTFVGSIYITLVCLLPEFLILKYSLPFYFGGTSLLIIVVVTMDFWSQVSGHAISNQYSSLLKKSSFKSI
jgi:preprotein translocase subunit SecY